MTAITIVALLRRALGLFCSQFSPWAGNAGTVFGPETVQVKQRPTAARTLGVGRCLRGSPNHLGSIAVQGKSHSPLFWCSVYCQLPIHSHIKRALCLLMLCNPKNCIRGPARSMGESLPARPRNRGTVADSVTDGASRFPPDKLARFRHTSALSTSSGYVVSCAAFLSAMLGSHLGFTLVFQDTWRLFWFAQAMGVG
jgi:hypothetical protein